MKVSPDESSAATLNLFHMYTHHSSHHAAPMFFSHVFRCLESPISKLLSNSCVTLATAIGYIRYELASVSSLPTWTHAAQRDFTFTFTFTFNYSQAWTEHAVKRTTVNDTITMCIQCYITLLYNAVILQNTQASSGLCSAQPWDCNQQTAGETHNVYPNSEKNK
jgi:hypothetical protein